MRAARLMSPRPAADAPLVVEQLEDVEPAAGEVVVEVSVCAVCRTDLQLCEGDLPPQTLPITPGHQVVGTVVAAGTGATHVVIGDRVGVAWIASTCGRCKFCASGRENLCDDARFTGWSRDGGFAEGMTARADFVYRMPDTLDAVGAAPLLCGGAIGLLERRSNAVDLVICDLVMPVLGGREVAEWLREHSPAVPVLFVSGYPRAYLEAHHLYDPAVPMLRKPFLPSRLLEAVEEQVRLQGSETTSARIGVAVLDQLRQLDEVVYLRFASVYKSFDGVADFHRELELLEKSASSAE